MDDLTMDDLTMDDLSLLATRTRFEERIAGRALHQCIKYERAGSADQFCQRGNAIAAFAALDLSWNPICPRAREGDKIRPEPP